MAAAAIMQARSTAQPITDLGVSPMAGPGSGSGTGTSTTGTSSSATISANDFLTLLVTEMQNQDPTATNDPNQYINQLVNVNSLEQLISINQNLQTALGTSTSTSTSSSSSGGVRAGTGIVGQAQQPSGASKTSQPGILGAGGIAQGSVSSRTIGGNLSVPGTNPAAERVAQALSGGRGARITTQ